jgi:hypothetical protein
MIMGIGPPQRRVRDDDSGPFRVRKTGARRSLLCELPVWLYLTIPGVTVFLVGGLVFLMMNSGGGVSAGPASQQQTGTTNQPGQKPAPKADLPRGKVPPDANSSKGPIAYWSFEDENPAALVADRSKNGNDGKAVGATRVDGIRGKALALTGKDAYFDYGTHPSLNFPANGAFTLALWFKTSSATGVLLSQRHSTDQGADIDLFLANGQLKAHVRHDKGFFPLGVEGKVAVNDDQWHHCALLRSGKDVELFVDGQQVGRNSGADAEGPITTDMRALCLEPRWAKEGRGEPGVPSTLTAAVDEFYIFNRALAAEEILKLAGR